MSYREELPRGWVRQLDERTGQPFWVDTTARPPRSIWVHPYEDEQFLNDHPEIRDKLAKSGDHLSPNDIPPPYTPRRHSYSGAPSGSPDMRESVSQPGSPRSGSSRAGPSSAGGSQKRGFFGKIKDKAIGTKEEREEARRQEELYMQRRAEERQRQIEELRRQRMSMPVYTPPVSRGQYYQTAGYAPAGPYDQSYGRQYYAPPPNNPYNTYGGYEGYGRYRGRQRNGFGGGGLALPIIGGLAGGLLLGDLIGGF